MNLKTQVVILVQCFGCIIYANDLVILAAFLTMSQAMIDLCDSVAKKKLNMSFNVKNSTIVTVYPSFRHLSACIILNACAIDQAESATYLAYDVCYIIALC